MPDIIHPELSYAVQGNFMSIYDKHGPMLHEEIYEGLIAHLMQQAGYRCQRQLEFNVLDKDAHIATFRTDVSLLPELIIEVKVALHKAQTVTYLKVTGADLGIVVSFGGPSLKYERVPNYISGKRSSTVVPPIPDNPNMLYPELTGKIRCCLYEVNGELGPGFWHHVYRDATKVELKLSGLPCEHKLWVDIDHDGWHAGRQRCNVLVVDDKVMVTPVAIKAVTEAMRGHLKAHLRRLYLKKS